MSRPRNERRAGREQYSANIVLSSLNRNYPRVVASGLQSPADMIKFVATETPGTN